MQRSGDYKYRNVSDGFYQIFQEKSNGSKIYNFYRGAGIFSVAFGLYTVFEFTFYETILAAVTNYYKTRNALINPHLEHDETSGAKERNLYHVVFSAFCAGALSAVIVNPFEYLLAMTQNTKGKSVMEVIKSTPSLKTLWRGTHFSI